MGTLVCFHAHPDDEAISTGGTIARAAAEGHRVVLVLATNGEWGESPADLGDQTLLERRRDEVAASAAALGVARIVWLGYEDSGMTGWAQNTNPGSFLQAPLDEAAERLAADIAGLLSAGRAPLLAMAESARAVAITDAAERVAKLCLEAEGARA